jgi:methionyl-tRNA synthetase
MSFSYITTPIYYVNSDPHIGHAYTNVISEAIANWEKFKGSKTFFLTGTDEHGQKIETAAKNLGKEPSEFVKIYADVFKNLADKLEIGYDDFIRTTEDRHKKVVQELWKILQNKGFIYLGHYKGWYSIRDEAFYDESELIDGKAPTGAPVEWREEESYFFKLSEFQNKLLEFYKKNPDFIIPNSRAHEIVNFVSGGLKDLSISRTNFTWGVKVPSDEKHVIYVWIDALTNYISALGLDTEKYKNYWVESKKIHVLGKDILRFHAVYWPAILMACDLPLPNHLVTHGWWMNDGQKISKSIGNVIDPFNLIEKYGLEYFKYFFLTETGINNDGNFKDERFIEKINSDLVNNFGNLVSRTTNMAIQYFNGKVTKPDDKYLGDFRDLLNAKEIFIKNYIQSMNEYKFNVASGEFMSFATEVTKFTDNMKPWSLAKKINEDGVTQLLNAVLYFSLDMVRVLTLALVPFLKQTSSLILKELGLQSWSIKDLSDVSPIGYDIDEKLNLFKRL